ncbi:hypothetical protein SAMN04515618_101702 [Collimonas sp. OK307]|nr:hypothetical protein SAMN04515618_101702 [Collimonas sp. OK307]
MVVMKNNLLRFSRLLRLAAVCVVPMLMAASTVHAADETKGGPLSLIITYHSTPANRVALREEMEKSRKGLFQHWKEQGILKDYRLLFNRYVDSGSWDAMALLTFSNPADAERWNKVEQANPAGLSKKALALTTAIDTAPADLVRNNAVANAPLHPTLMVIPYETMVSADEYLKYADGYVIPQFEGWIQEGVLSRYGIYVNRYAAGRPWSTMVILEYKNDAALGAREAVVAKVRARLKENPEWKAISDSKKNVRAEKLAVIADSLMTP